MLNLFYKANRRKHENRGSTLPFYTALLSMFLCMICLAGTTWAWFTANQEVDIGSITAAEWSLNSVKVYQIETTSQLTQTASDGDAQRSRIAVDVTATDDGVVFDASADTQYLVTASMNGNSSNGFLLVETCDGDFYSTDSDISFNLLLTEDCTVALSVSWGSCYGNADTFPEDYIIGNGEVPECACKVLCTEDAVNEECKICIKNHNACIGVAPKCSCTEKCTEDVYNTDCQVCSTDIAGCIGKERKECICTDKCVDEENTDCPVCAEDMKSCTGKVAEPVNPVCSCEVKCAEINESCEVCKDSVDKCIGKDEEISTETDQPTEPVADDESTVPPPTSEPTVTEPAPTDTPETPMKPEAPGSEEDSGTVEPSPDEKQPIPDDETAKDEESEESTESAEGSDFEDTPDNEQIATSSNADQDESDIVSDDEITE